jgi:hypothetical protein
MLCRDRREQDKDLGIPPIMKEIQLTQGKVALVDDEDFDYLNKFKWQACKNRAGNWYAQRHLEAGGNIRMHCELFPGVNEIDHKNSKGLDNQKHNLRPATRGQNNANGRKRKGCSSRFKGVCWNKQKQCWMTRIHVLKTQIHLGLFDSEKEAARAYDRAAKRYYGEFARPNFP